MKSFFQIERGIVPREVHKDLAKLPGDLKEDELGRGGFNGRTSQLYRRNDPTRFRATGEYRLRDANCLLLETPDRTDPRGLPLRLVENEDARVLLSRRSAAMPFYTRSVDVDACYFVHVGTGTFETEYGPISYEPGDYVLIPKATTYRIVPDAPENLFIITETIDQLIVPDAGALGRTGYFDPSTIYIPDPFVIEDDREWEIVLQHGGAVSSIFYPHNPCDVAGWKGDVFPFRFNIRDWNVILSDTVHLPPTVHQFLGARGVVICHFLPRPSEGRVGAERLPWFHRNVDYDEVAFYHGGSFLGIPLPKGQFAHSPQGIHHGPPQEARHHARATHANFSTVDWQILALDFERPMRPTEAFKKAVAAQTR